MLPYPSRKKKSKKLFLLTTVAAAFVFGASYLIIENTSHDQVVAKINGQKIFKSEVETKLSSVFENNNNSNKIPELEKLPKEIIEILVKEIYLEKELTKEAKKSEVATSKEVKNKIEESKNRILRQAYVDSILKNEITNEKVNDKYLELTKELEGKKEYKIFHIVVKTKEEAEKIAQELNGKNGGKKFAELAKKYSIDPDTADKGGEIDYTLEDAMIKEISSVVASLEKDQVSNPIQTKYGWHLVKVGDVRDAKPLAFEDVKENIHDQLVQDRVNELNNKLIKNAKIQLLIQLKEIEKSAEKKSATPSEAIPAEETKATSTDKAAEEKTVKENEEVKSEDAAKAEENSEKSNEKHKKHKQSKR